VNIFERNDHPSNFFNPRCPGHSVPRARLLAPTTGFQRYREQSALSAMRQRGRTSSGNKSAWKSSDNDHTTMIFDGSILSALTNPRHRRENWIHTKSSSSKRELNTDCESIGFSWDQRDSRIADSLSLVFSTITASQFILNLDRLLSLSRTRQREFQTPTFHRLRFLDGSDYLSFIYHRSTI
jgi:hypothetical protein